MAPRWTSFDERRPAWPRQVPDWPNSSPSYCLCRCCRRRHVQPAIELMAFQHGGRIRCAFVEISRSSSSLVVFLAPMAVAGGWWLTLDRPISWRSADWSSTGVLPSSAATRRSGDLCPLGTHRRLQGRVLRSQLDRPRRTPGCNQLCPLRQGRLGHSGAPRTPMPPTAPGIPTARGSSRS